MNYNYIKKATEAREQRPSILVTVLVGGYTEHFKFYNLTANQIKSILKGWKALSETKGYDTSLESFLSMNGIAFENINPQYDLYIEL